MTRFKTFFLAVALASLSTGAWAEGSNNGTTKAVLEALAAYRDAWLGGDEAAVLDTLSDQVQVFVPGSSGGKLDGKQAVREFWFPDSDTSYPIRGYEITGQEVYGDGGLAVVTGKSQLDWDTVANGKVIESATSNSAFITVWRKEGGRWRIFRQMYQMR
jgi:ketosteroid isomerase-like protein